MDQEPISEQKIDQPIISSDSNEVINAEQQLANGGELRQFGEGVLETLSNEKGEPVTIEQRENLEDLRNFFRINNAIKVKMIGVKLSYTDEGYGTTDIYYEKLVKDSEAIGRLFDELGEKLKSLGFGMGDLVKEKKNLLMDKLYEDMSAKGLDFADLDRICEKDITSMNPEFVKTVSTEIAGYYMFKDIFQVAKEAKTFNELLYLAHMDLQSNEDFYEKLPKWGEFHEGKARYDAYGEETKYSKDIFNSVISALKEDQIDVLGNEIPPAEIVQLFSLDDKVQLLVRDYGHALSIEVDTSDPRAAFVRYSIPKSINLEVINKLPGVRKITPSDSQRTGTSGEFEIPYDENIGKNISDFIKQVPTDEMMPR